MDGWMDGWMGFPVCTLPLVCSPASVEVKGQGYPSTADDGIEKTFLLVRRAYLQSEEFV